MITTDTLARAQRNYDRQEPATFGPSEDRVQEIAATLFTAGGECDPADSMNFAEAVSDASDTDLRRVAAFVRDNECEQACAALTRIASEYWREKAYAKASDIAEDEYLGASRKARALAHYTEQARLAREGVAK